MMRKVLSVVCYVLAGVFFYTTMLIAFIDDHPLLAKLAMMGGFCSIGAIALVIGMAFARFRNWRRHIGVVMLSAAAVTAFVVLVVVFVVMAPEMRQYYPDQKFDFFSDYVIGFLTLALFLVGGAVLLWRSRPRGSP